MSETKELIVQALGELGYNSRQVSVRKKRCTHSWDYIVTINDPAVNPFAVDQAVTQFESVRRDEATGDMLQGGNTFVSVQYAPQVEDIWAHKYMAKVAKTIAEMQADPDHDRGRRCEFVTLFWSSPHHRSGIRLYNELKNSWHRYDYSVTPRGISLAMFLIEAEAQTLIF